MQPEADAQHCPICGGLNQCAVTLNAQAQDCWCFASEVVITPAMRAKARAQNKQASCICPACVRRLSEQAGTP